MGGGEEKGVAYVCYQTSEDAEAAIVGLNGQTVSFNTSSVLLRSLFSLSICRTTSPSFPCTCLACSYKCWTDHLSGNGRSCLLLSALHSCNLHTASIPRTHGIKAYTFLWCPPQAGRSEVHNILHSRSGSSCLSSSDGLLVQVGNQVQQLQVVLAPRQRHLEPRRQPPQPVQRAAVSGTAERSSPVPYVQPHPVPSIITPTFPYYAPQGDPLSP